MRRAETVEAVSSVFFFQDQIFVVVMQNHLEAFPGYHAFPAVSYTHLTLPTSDLV